VEVERRPLLQTSGDASIDTIRQLMQLKGIGINGAWLLVMEFFGWRVFKNRREVGGLAGFTPTPYQSGESAREQVSLSRLNYQWPECEVHPEMMEGVAARPLGLERGLKG